MIKKLLVTLGIATLCCSCMSAYSSSFGQDPSREDKKVIHIWESSDAYSIYTLVRIEGHDYIVVKPIQKDGVAITHSKNCKCSGKL